MLTRTWMLLIMLALTAPALADVVKIGAGKPVVVQKPDQPTRGMSQNQVISRFGEPQNKHAAVGEPPIIRWDYAGYSVYFEGNYVLHAVDRSGR